MNFAWAIEQLNKGNKVRRSSWENQAFFLYKNTVNNIIYQHGSDGDPEDVRCSTSSAEIFADDWENHACPTAKEPCRRPESVLFVKKHMDIHDRVENDLRDLKVHTHPDVGLMVNTLNRLESQLKILEGRVNGISSDFYNHKHTISAPKQGD